VLLLLLLVVVVVVVVGVESLGWSTCGEKSRPTSPTATWSARPQKAVSGTQSCQR